MQIQKQNVIVMESDPQVLKGLVLLLEDMQFSVISVSSLDTLQKIATKLSASPDLLLFPFEITGKSGMVLVKYLRDLFAYRIPAILLSYENEFDPEQFVDEEVVVLSGHVNPTQLRNTIKKIIHSALHI